MNKGFLLAPLLWAACVSPVLAGEVYMWKDAEGHVHFGDQGAPSDSRRIEVAEPVTVKNELKSLPPAKEPAKAPDVKPEAGAEEPKQRFGLTPDRIAQCEKLARQLVEYREVNNQEADRKRVAAQIKRLCPKTSYNCDTNLSHPAENRCEVGPPTLEGTLVGEHIRRR